MKDGKPETSFGDPDHVSDTETQEMFDRISKENYERLDRECEKALCKNPTFGFRIIYGVMCIFGGVAVASLVYVSIV